MVDSSDKEKMTKACEELHKVIADSELSHAPVLIFANKQDVQGAMSKDEVYDALKLREVVE